ncbi:MAG: hypothetical protein SGJ15_07305 [Bacteroidota bacterium]|nr:hypothetical protein [Bacteroidota bacterium]
MEIMKKGSLIMLAAILTTSLNAQSTVKIPDGWDTTKYPIKEIVYTPSTKKLITEGIYNGKNLFIKNSFGIGGQGFCVSQVNVNGNITTDEINAEVFQVDLSLHPLKLGDPLKVEIFHKDCCTPVIMNPNAIKPKDNTLTIHGIYITGSLFVMNPRSGDGKAYSVKEISVNGKKVSSKIDADVFEIDFYKMGFKMDDKLKIEFTYESGYDPFLMNSEILVN